MGLDKNFNTAGANEVQLGDGQLKPDLSTLSNCLKEGKPLADTGDLYSTIQDAENAASSWVFVPPGTFDEYVTIDTSGLTLQGSGYETKFTVPPTVTASDVTVSRLRIETSGGGKTNVQAQRVTVHDVTFAGTPRNWIRDSDNTTDMRIINCRFIDDPQSYGIYLNNNSQRTIIANCLFVSDTLNTITNSAIGDDCIFAYNIFYDTGSNSSAIEHGGGAGPECDDGIIIGNRVTNYSSDGIDIGTSDNIVANNRVDTSIVDNGLSTELDGNKTGPSN